MAMLSAKIKGLIPVVRLLIIVAAPCTATWYYFVRGTKLDEELVRHLQKKASLKPRLRPISLIGVDFR